MNFLHITYHFSANLHHLGHEKESIATKQLRWIYPLEVQVVTVPGQLPSEALMFGVH